MYPAVEKDVSLSWIHISRNAMPVTLPGWARGRPVSEPSRRQPAGWASSDDRTRRRRRPDQVLRLHADGRVMRLPHLVDKASRDRAEHRQVDRATAHAAARERELLRRIHEHGDTRARDQLAEEMLPLARALAGRYANRGEPLDDLVQVACIGIMKAIDGFDLTREVRFSSYATPTVLGEIKRHFRDKTWAMRVPRGLQELQLRVAKARDKLTHELGRSPTVQEIADRRRGPLRGGAGHHPERQRAAHALARRADRRGRHAGRLAGLRRPRDRARRDARAARRRLRRALPARPRGPAPALRARPDPGRDRRAHRGQPDAGLTADQTGTRPGAAAKSSARPTGCQPSPRPSASGARHRLPEPHAPAPRRRRASAEREMPRWYRALGASGSDGTRTRDLRRDRPAL